MHRMSGVSTGRIRHLAAQHSDNPRKFKCTVPEKDFNGMDHLTTHSRGFHNRELREILKKEEKMMSFRPKTRWGRRCLGGWVKLPIWRQIHFEGTEEGETLCMYSYTKFQMSADLEVERQRKLMLTNDPSFGRFCKAAILQQKKRMNVNSIIMRLDLFEQPRVFVSVVSIKLGTPWAQGTALMR